MKDKQWLLDEINKEYLSKREFEAKDSYTSPYLVGLSTANKLVEQLEEPQKPVIPQFVADYIEFFKEWHGEKNYSVSGIMLLLNPEDNGYEGSQVTRDYIDLNLGATKLIDAYRYGYTVEEEPKYVVRFPDSKFGTPTYGTIVRNYDKKKMAVSYGSPGVNIKPNKYTEEEIKEVGERYWQFAEKVED